MIKGSATIQFGSGSVASAYGFDEISKNGIILHKTCPPGDINPTDVTRINKESIISNPEVVIYYTNVKSIDASILMLTKLRDQMIKYGSVEDG